jgi:hypothetical protein
MTRNSGFKAEQELLHWRLHWIRFWHAQDICLRSIRRGWMITEDQSIAP